MRRLVVLCALVLVPTAGGGSYSPPPGDCCPAWSPDGTYLSFLTLRGGYALHDIKPSGTAEQTLLTGNFAVAALSPDWKRLAWADSGQLKVKTIATGQIRTISAGTPSFVWAPDSSRLALVTDGDLSIAGLDGTVGPPLAHDVAGFPTWSPTGDRIAVVEHSDGVDDVHVVRPSGEDVNITAGDRGTSFEPRWSRTGVLAFLTLFDKQVTLDVANGLGDIHTLKINEPVSDFLGWLPKGTAVALRIYGQIVAVDIASGHKRKLLSSGENLVWSPNGKLLAFAAGGECRDRVGIYVARADGSQPRRITNDCRILGTSGDDTLHGTDLADVLVGLGGNDRLFASDPGYVGDTLLGGPGNDVLIGGFRQDTLDGGPGADVLDGGPSGDLLIGGKGRDHLNGQGGADVIRAVDGERDVVTCGPNAYGPSGRDTVYADRIDRIAADCEIVNRR